MQQQGIATRKWRRDTRTGTSPVQNNISNPRQPKNTGKREPKEAKMDQDRTVEGMDMGNHHHRECAYYR